MRRWLYPILGVVLAQGAPVGLLLLRLAAGAVSPSPSGLVAELRGDPALYLYLALATALVMGTLGGLLGRLEDRLERSSVSDELTGLANRRSFERRLDQEVARAARSGDPLSLVMLDLDGFKQVNDRHGHATGDEVLARVGRAIAGASRQGDIACRYGGEELAIICPRTRGADALAVAERLRQSIAGLPDAPPEDLSPGTPVTLSAGVAELQVEADGRARLVARADAALYRAKAAGRDRCVLG